MHGNGTSWGQGGGLVEGDTEAVFIEIVSGQGSEHRSYSWTLR